MAAPVKNMRTILPTGDISGGGGGGTGGGSSFSPSRTNASIGGGVLSSVAAGATVSDILTMAKSYSLLKVVVAFKTRVRLYSSATARDNDVARPHTVPIASGTQHGMICDLYLDTSDKLTWILSPEAEGSNMDDGTSTVYYSVTNLENATESLSVVFTYLPLES